jgi:hypothetical protein
LRVRASPHSLISIWTYRNGYQAEILFRQYLPFGRFSD